MSSAIICERLGSARSWTIDIELGEQLSGRLTLRRASWVAGVELMVPSVLRIYRFIILPETVRLSRRPFQV